MEAEEVSLKLLLNSSDRWPRWTSSSSIVEACWEARWGRHTCSQHTGSKRKSRLQVRQQREREREVERDLWSDLLRSTWWTRSGVIGLVLL